MISVSQKIQVYPFHSTSRPLPIQKSLEKNKQIYLCIWLDTTHRLAPAGSTSLVPRRQLLIGQFARKKVVTWLSASFNLESGFVTG